MNKQLLQKLNSKKCNDSVVLAFLQCSCYIQNLVIRQKEPISQISVIPFSNLSNWHLVRFGGDAPSHLNYIAYCRPHFRYCYYFASHFRCCYYFFHTFAVVIISPEEKQ